MTTRAESAAATRRALLDSAAGLLDEGGAEAVTLRAVGSRAGVSRGAAYGHFADKEDLLTAVAIERWERMTEDLGELQSDQALSDRERLTQALLLTLGVARERPHLYKLMFTTPLRNPEALVEAASVCQDTFISIVTDVVGSAEARRSGALLMSTAHGIAGMEQSGQLSEAKWGTTGDELVRTLISVLGR